MLGYKIPEMLSFFFSLSLFVCLFYCNYVWDPSNKISQKAQMVQHFCVTKSLVCLVPLFFSRFFVLVNAFYSFLYGIS